MFETFKNIFRKKCLKKSASGIETGMRPIKAINSAAVLINAGCGEFPKTEKLVLDYFKAHNIELEIIYLDTSKGGKAKVSAATEESRITKNDLNWFGRLSKEKSEKLLSRKKDLFICLTGRCDFTVKFLSAAFPATFKIGGETSAYDEYDIVVHASSDTDKGISELFSTVTTILESIR